jgi:hypothetical protein
VNRPNILVVCALVGCGLTGAGVCPAQGPTPPPGAGVAARAASDPVPLVLLRRSAIKAPGGSTDDVLVVADQATDVFARRAAWVMQDPGGFGQFALRLDRYARTYLQRDPATTPARLATLAQPAFLFLSDRQGGFPAESFWLEQPDGSLKPMRDVTFVDMVVDERDFTPGTIDGLEEIYAHELGHLVMAALAGPAPAKATSEVHFITVRTDAWSAFVEGWGEHFQPMGVDHAAGQRPRTVSTDATSVIAQTWYSRFAREQVEGCIVCPANLRFLKWQGPGEQRLRDEPLRANRFIYQVDLPPGLRGDRRPAFEARMYRDVMPPGPDGQLKNGPQLMESEGVVGALFYRLVTDDRLRNSYRGTAFYEPFLPSDLAADLARVGPRAFFPPAENVYLKLFDVMHRSFTWGRWPALDLVKAYVKQFPDEAPAVYDVFFDVTRGVTVDRAARARHLEPGYLDGLRQRLLAGDVALDAAQGPPIWMVSPSMSFGMGLFRYFLVPNSFTFDLNAADVADLRSVPGVSAALAEAIVKTRDARGTFDRVADLVAVPGMTPDLLARFTSMAARMQERLGRARRQGSDPAWVKSLLAPVLRGTYYAAAAWQYGEAAAISGAAFGLTMWGLGLFGRRQATAGSAPRRRWWRRAVRAIAVGLGAASGPCIASAWMYGMNVMPSPLNMAGVGAAWGLSVASLLTLSGRMPRGNPLAFARVVLALFVASSVVGLTY